MESHKISPARSAAAYVLSRCRRFDAWSQQTVESARDKFGLDARDAALCSRMCLSVLQNAALCDFYIDSYSSVRTDTLEPQVRDILRLGIVQLLFLDRIPQSAAVNECVELAKRASPKSSGLVNAVLRRIAQNRQTLPPIPETGTAKELSIRFSHPSWLCERLVSRYGYDFARAFLQANNTPPMLTVTANLCRTDAVSLAKRFLQAGIEARVSVVSEVSVDVCAVGAVTALPGFAEGDYFVQDAAAAAGVTAARPRPGMRVLDACAAPGGKSLLSALYMRDEGEILSCDVHEKKLGRIRENAARLGLKSIRTMAMDAADPPEMLWESFDLVIADVPCSGFGVIRKKPEIRYKEPLELARLGEVQRRILSGAAKCVRPGGALLYSTCTVFAEENEAVTAAFLQENGDFRLTQQRTIWPQEYGTDGFYYALMERL